MAGGDLLRDCLVLAIEMARDEAELGRWWKAHQGALKLLSADDLVLAVAAKDRKKGVLVRSA